MAFCDWLTIYQDHPEGGLPRINDGAVWAVDTDGEISWTTERAISHVGSYDTKIRIQSDGYRVKLDGNIGRLNRTDNVFGYSVSQCIQLANLFLESFQLPAFTAPKFNPSAGRMQGGAVITRVDLTENYSGGTRKNLTRIIQFLAGQDMGRRATVKDYGDSGVSWNEGSKFWYSKFYDKSQSLGIHATPEIQTYVNQYAIGRHEIKLASRYLAHYKLNSIDKWTDKEGKDMDNIIYGRFTDVLTRGTCARTELENIPKKLGHLALAWRAGKDLWNDDDYSQRTRRQWRRELLAYGIDIKQPSNISRIQSRIEVLSLEPVQAPVWYWNNLKVA